MTRANEELSEYLAARDLDTGVCVICECGPDEHHNHRSHDLWEAADDATWD